jgi:hypothetical protein
MKRFLQQHVLDPTNACMMHPGPPGPPSATRALNRSNHATEHILIIMGALVGSLAAVYVGSSLCGWRMRPTQVREHIRLKKDM